MIQTEIGFFYDPQANERKVELRSQFRLVVKELGGLAAMRVATIALLEAALAEGVSVQDFHNGLHGTLQSVRLEIERHVAAQANTNTEDNQ